MIALPAAYCLAFGPPTALSEAAADAVDMAAGTLRAAGAASGASLVGAAAAAGLAALAVALSAPPMHAATVCLVAALVFSGADAGPCLASASSGTVTASASSTLFSTVAQALPQEPASRLWLGVVAAAAAQAAALLTIISRWDWEEQAKARIHKINCH